MDQTSIQYFGAAVFLLALFHTFTASRLRKLFAGTPHGSWSARLGHLLGEVELVFALWSLVLLIGVVVGAGPGTAFTWIRGLNFTEPLFVLVIMSIASTRPLIGAAEKLVNACAKILPLPRNAALYGASLVVGPLLGSFITEPAAMTVTVLMLREQFFARERSEFFKYLTMAVVFVNVSIGGVMTPFAAPPVLMVAGKWNWDLAFMMSHFGWKAAFGVVVNAALATMLLARELQAIAPRGPGKSARASWSLAWLHLILLAFVVWQAHHAMFFLAGFVVFLVIYFVTRERQSELRWKESALVAAFLAGLVVLGSVQSWWLKPLIEGMDNFRLFLGATALTALTDNAALTYLGAQVEGLTEVAKYALVAGAVSGGGLTVIANAPNPAGYSLLQDRFGQNGVEPLKLIAAAAAPTLVAMACFWLL